MCDASFRQALSGERWVRRLVELARKDASAKGLVRASVSQLLVNWREWYGAAFEQGVDMIRREGYNLPEPSRMQVDHHPSPYLARHLNLHSHSTHAPHSPLKKSHSHLPSTPPIAQPPALSLSSHPSPSFWLPYLLPCRSTRIPHSPLRLTIALPHARNLPLCSLIPQDCPLPAAHSPLPSPNSVSYPLLEELTSDHSLFSDISHYHLISPPLEFLSSHHHLISLLRPPPQSHLFTS